LRVKARVFGLHRSVGFTEEVAVCEDLSKGGISFKEQERIRGRDATGSGGAVSPGGGSDFCADTDCIFAADCFGGVVSAWAAYLRVPD